MALRQIHEGQDKQGIIQGEAGKRGKLEELNEAVKEIIQSLHQEELSFEEIKENPIGLKIQVIG